MKVTPWVVRRSAGRDLCVDVFSAEGDRHRVAVVLLHGGGWTQGHRGDVYPYARELARLGFVAVAAEYRLLGEAAWPAQILDVADVICWVRWNANRLDVDTDKIVCEGFSAGGHLALLAAGIAGKNIYNRSESSADASLNGVVALFAPVDLTANAFPFRPPPLTALLGETGNEDRALAASPLTYAAADFPPTFLLSGLEDHHVRHQHAQAMFSALAAANVKTDLHLFHGHAHEFARLPSMLAPVHAEISLFLRRSVMDPLFYARESRDLNPFASSADSIL